MALKFRDKILLIELENAYGTDPNPTGTANAILATDIRLTPMEGSDVSRELETPYLGAQGTIPTELHMKLMFKIELEPSGTAGTAPKWGPVLRGCAVAQTIVAGASVTYNPVSDGHESLAIYLFIDETRYVMLGTRGNCKFMVPKQGIPYLEFEMTGLFVTPTEETRPTPTLTGFKKPNVATTANTPTFTMGGTDFVMREFTLDLGNQINAEFLIGDESIEISDKSEAIETTVRAQALTDFDPFTLALEQTAVPVVLQHGTDAGRIATLNVPAAQMQRPSGLNDADGIKEWPLSLVPLPTAGNDQWTLTLT